MKIKLKIADNAEEWDALLDSCPHATVFHLWDWLKIMEKHTNSKLYPLIGMKGSTPIGVFPLFYQKKYLLKFVFSPPPKTAASQLGPLLLNYDHLKQSKRESTLIDLQDSVDDFISQQLKPNYIQIHTALGITDPRPFKWNKYEVEPTYTYTLDLTNGCDHLWGQFKKELRKNINNARKQGVEVHQGSKEELEVIYDSLSERYQQQSKLVPPTKDYLFDIYDRLGQKNIRVFSAEYQGRFVAGLVVVCYRDKAFSWFGAAKTDLNGIYPNDLLQWEALRWAGENNFKCYEIVGANTPRICTFKVKYNPTLSMHYSIVKYSPRMIKWLESAYIRVIKPLNARLRRVKIEE